MQSFQLHGTTTIIILALFGKARPLRLPNQRHMDLLGGYNDSSSDEVEDQPRTTIAMPCLKVNPSKEEVWSEHFQKIKEF